MPHRIRHVSRAAASALLPALAAGCLSSGSDVTGTTTTTAPTVPYLRVIQGVSDATAGVDASVNGTAAFSNARVGSGLDYVRVPATPRVAFADGASGTAFFDQTVAAITGAGVPFTVVAYGRVASGGTPAATATVLADTTAAPTGSNALFRVFNTVDYVTPGTGTPVDVFIYPSGTTRPATPDVTALAWGARSPYVVKATTGGTMQVDVYATGTESTATAPLFTAGTAVVAGSIRTLVLLDPLASAGSAGPGSVLTLRDYPETY